MKIDVTKQSVLKVLDGFSNKGFEIAIVGGAVRNLIAGTEISDWDFTTSATPEQILDIFEGYYDNNYGTVRIRIDDDEFEVTTYRSEEEYSDGRRPNSLIWGKSLEDDLSRRDFTINAMALKYVNKKLTLVDPYGGQLDLKNKTVRTVGDSEMRFSEDGLRIMRGIRFAIQLGFGIEPKTLNAISKLRQMLEKISNERIRDEFLKICLFCKKYEDFMLLKDTGIISIILPELDKCYGVEQKSPDRHHQYDVWKHNVMSMILCPSNDQVVKFAALLHDIGKPDVADITTDGVRTFYNHEVVGAKIARSITRRWNMSNKDSDRIYKLVRWHLFTVSEFQTDKAIRRFIRNIQPENLNDLMDVRTGDRLGSGASKESWRLKKFKDRIIEISKTTFEIKDLKVNGDDVMKVFELSPGPQIRKVLENVFEKVDSDELPNDRKALMRYLEQLRSSEFLEKN